MKTTINRRRFVKGGALALVATKCFGAGPIANTGSTTHLAPLDAVDEVMKAAVSNVLEINNFLKRLASDFENLKKTKAEEQLRKDECTKALDIISAVVLVVVACVIAASTFGAGGQMTALASVLALRQVKTLLDSLAKLEVEIEKQNLMGAKIRGAIVRFRQLTEDFKDVLVARDIFFHISQDRTHAKKLLDAIRAKNRPAIEETLKRDVPVSNVVVTEVKEDNGAFVSVRIGKLTHCLSTSSQCSGRVLRPSR